MLRSLVAVLTVLCFSTAAFAAAPPSAELKARFEEGVALAKDEHLEEAKKIFSEIVADHPEFGPAYFYLGMIRLRRGDVLEAAGYFQRAIDNGADNAQIYFLLGTTHSAAGRLDRAEAAYLESTRRNPQQFAAFHELGLVYFRKEELDKATAAFKQALKNDPKSGKTMLMAGMCYLKMNKPEHAIEYVTELRGIRDEQKATHLENLIRQTQMKAKMADPGNQQLRPATAHLPVPTPEGEPVVARPPVNPKAGRMPSKPKVPARPTAKPPAPAATAAPAPEES